MNETGMRFLLAVCAQVKFCFTNLGSNCFFRDTTLTEWVLLPCREVTHVGGIVEDLCYPYLRPWKLTSEQVVQWWVLFEKLTFTQTWLMTFRNVLGAALAVTAATIYFKLHRALLHSFYWFSSDLLADLAWKGFSQYCSLIRFLAGSLASTVLELSILVMSTVLLVTRGFPPCCNALMSRSIPNYSLSVGSCDIRIAKWCDCFLLLLWHKRQSWIQCAFLHPNAQN